MVKKVWRTDRQTDGLNQSYSCLVAAKKSVKIGTLSGKVRQRSGNFIAGDPWEPCTRQLDVTVPSTCYVSNNCIYLRTHLFAGTDSFAIDLMTMKDWSFSQHRPPDTRHQQSCRFFLLAVLIAGDCTMTLVFHMLRKILQFIYTFGRNTTLSLEYLGPAAVFQ